MINYYNATPFELKLSASCLSADEFEFGTLAVTVSSHYLEYNTQGDAELMCLLVNTESFKNAVIAFASEFKILRLMQGGVMS